MKKKKMEPDLPFVKIAKREQWKKEAGPQDTEGG